MSRLTSEKTKDPYYPTLRTHPLLYSEPTARLKQYLENRKTKTEIKKKERNMNTIQYLFAAYCHAPIALLVLLGIDNDGSRQSKPRVPTPRADPTFTVSQQTHFC